MGSCDIFEVVGNRNRRRIIELIAERPRYVSELSEELDVGQKAVIDHLRVLQREGLVSVTRGRHNRKYFRLSKSIHAELFIAPNAARTVVREVPLERDSSPRTSPPERVRRELEALDELSEEMNKLNSEVLRRMDALLESLSEEDVKDDLLKLLIREVRK